MRCVNCVWTLAHVLPVVRLGSLASPGPEEYTDRLPLYLGGPLLTSIPTKTLMGPMAGLRNHFRATQRIHTAMTASATSTIDQVRQRGGPGVLLVGDARLPSGFDLM